MALSVSDITFFKSMTVTDTDANGGRMDETSEVVSGVKYNLFPRVSYTERTNGVTRYRKEFMANRNADDEVGYNALLAILKHTGGNDRFYVRSTGQTTTQSDVDSLTAGWRGGGALAEDVAAGATQVKINFPSDDYDIPAGGYLIIGAYDSATDSFEDLYVLGIQDESYSETVGTGDGSTTSFSATLANTPISEGSVELSYTIAGNTYTGTDDGEGNITGSHISSGSIDYTTGDLSVTFDAAPDSGADITCDYSLDPATWSANTATINLSEQVPVDYTTTTGHAGVAVALGDLGAQKEDVELTSGSGTFDEDHLLVYNDGTVYDEWTITFTSSTQFTCSGTYEGAQVGGSITADYAPTNPRTSQPFFKIETSAWGGSFASGDKLTFTTIPAAAGLFWKEVVPPATDRAADNKVYSVWVIE